MIYKVRARLRPGTEAALLQKLTDGTVAGQRPDGAEIVASMERAVMTGDGHVEWSETCYCSPPLAHERETVLDHHFDDIETAEIGAYEQYDGTPEFRDWVNQTPSLGEFTLLCFERGERSCHRRVLARWLLHRVPGLALGALR